MIYGAKGIVKSHCCTNTKRDHLLKLPSDNIKKLETSPNFTDLELQDGSTYSTKV